MKIIKPLRLGLLHKTYQFLGLNRFVVTPICFFRLGVQQTEILTENIQWPTVMSSLQQGQVLDMAMPKICGEVLIAANAYAPDQKPVSSMNVGFKLGELKKVLTVTGERQWQWRIAPLYHITEPQPFLCMPVDYSHAYGGKAYRYNPLGKGHEPGLKRWFGKRESFSLPNIQYPGVSFRRTQRLVQLAGFGPLDMAWPQRMSKAGTYNKTWLKNEYPGLPRNIDWHIFNAAPADQQIQGFFNGDETYQLIGMHPERKRIAGSLPAIKARSFVTRKTTQGQIFEEVMLKLDTVWFFPDKEIGALLFRGEAPVSDSDALDIEHTMLAYEHLHDTPRKVEYYRDILKKRTDPKTAIAHVFNEAQLSPEKTVAQCAIEDAEVAAMQEKALQEQQRIMDETLAEIFTVSNLEVPQDFKKPKAEPNPLAIISPQAIARGDFDLSDFLEKTEALVENAKAQGGQQTSAMHAEQEKLKAATAPYPLPQQDYIESLDEQKYALKTRVMQTPTDFPQSQVLMQAITDAKAQTHDQEIHTITEDKLQKQLQDAFLQMQKARQVSPRILVSEKALPDECKHYLRELVLQLLSQGQILRGRDLAGADLSGMDFTGMDLQNILLENAILNNTKFEHCKLAGAVFSGARLNGAQFDGANLEKANFSTAKGTGVQFKNTILDTALFIETEIDHANFSGATLTRSNFHKARLAQADFSQCKFTDVSLIEAELQTCCWDRSRFEKTLWVNSVLENNSFNHCFLQRCALINVNAERSDFSHTVMNRVQAGGECRFQRSDFRFARLVECGWRKADFEFSCFDDAVMAKSDFGETRLCNTMMRKAVLYRSVLSNADLSDADLEEAELFEALLRKTNFSRATLKKSNLYNADISEAIFDDAVLDGIKTLNPIRKQAA